MVVPCIVSEVQVSLTQVCVNCADMIVKPITSSPNDSILGLDGHCPRTAPLFGAMEPADQEEGKNWNRGGDGYGRLVSYDPPSARQ